MGEDDSPAAQLRTVRQQGPVTDVVLHRLLKKVTFADEEVRAFSDRPQRVGPFRVSGIGDDFPGAFHPQRIRGGAAAVDHPDRKNGQIARLRHLSLDHLDIF